MILYTFSGAQITQILSTHLVYYYDCILTIVLLQVARRPDPLEDAAVIQEVRKKVGWDIELRVDANQRWTYQQALQFGSQVKSCNLQYIEVLSMKILQVFYS